MSTFNRVQRGMFVRNREQRIRDFFRYQVGHRQK